MHIKHRHMVVSPRRGSRFFRSIKTSRQKLAANCVKFRGSSRIYRAQVAAEDELPRIDIVAPHSGIVHQLSVHTVGGVVSSAEPIMLIVPEGDDLALEVQIAPKDIDQLQLGQKTVLRMSAFNLQTTPEVNGYVNRIAADLTTDEKTGVSYYLARLAVSPEELAKLKNLRLMPGMPAEAMIQTGERTALSYLVKPLSDQINRPFKEK